MESNNVNPNNENVIAINLNLFYFFFLKIVKIEFKMKLHFILFFYLEFSYVLAKLDFPYLSPHLSKWNESKLSMFIKI